MYYPKSLDLSRYGQDTPLVSGLVSTYGYSEYNGINIGVQSDVVQNAIDLLIEQFKNSADLHKLIGALLSPAQEIEYVLGDIITLTALEIATADQLDIIGEIVGESRESRSDTEYRNAIKIRIFLNSSTGSAETIIMLCRFLTRASTVRYLEAYPAKCILTFKTIYTPPVNLQSALESVAPAGVKLSLYQSDDDEDFSFGEENEFYPDTDMSGFGENDFPSEGGKFVEKI